MWLIGLNCIIRLQLMSFFIIVVLEIVVCCEYVHMVCIPVCVFTYVNVHVYVQVHIHVHACAWMCSQNLISGVSLHHSPHFLLKQGFSVEPRVCQNGSCSCPTSSKGHTILRVLELDEGNHTHPTYIWALEI